MAWERTDANYIKNIYHSSESNMDMLRRFIEANGFVCSFSLSFPEPFSLSFLLLSYPCQARFIIIIIILSLS